MTAGFSATNVVNKWLDWLAGNAETAPAANYVQLHTGDPGSAGTANVSAVTTRSLATSAASSGGSRSLTGTLPSWSMTATETITHISVWSASTSGTFLHSIALTTSKSVVSGDTLTLATLAVSVSPLAA
jgi:hypothetical protein